MQSLAGNQQPNAYTGGSGYSLQLPVQNTLMSSLLGKNKVASPTSDLSNLDTSNMNFDFSGGGLANNGYTTNPDTSAFNWKNPDTGGFDFGGIGGLANTALGAASLFMNYQSMKDAKEYNNRNMSLLEEQQGLAKRAADTNYQNQQHMAEQMGGYVNA